MTKRHAAKQPARQSTACGRELGAVLRAERIAAELTNDSLCEDLGWSAAKNSKIEKGVRGATERDIGTLLGRYGTDRATRDHIFGVAADVGRATFTRSHGALSSDFLVCLRLHESTARTISTYEPLVIPELAQSKDYTQAMFPDSSGVVPNERAERQAAVLRAGKQVSLFVHEASLSNEVGGPAVMHDQMMRLAFMCDWEQVDVRLVPLTAGGPSWLRSASTYLTFTGHMKPLAYVSTDAATLFHDEEHGVGTHREKHRVLNDLALSSARSRSVFERWADEYDRCTSVFWEENPIEPSTVDGALSGSVC